MFAGGLHPANTATVVRIRDGEVLTTDGPFAETKEQLRATSACGGPVEVRPFQEDVEA